MSETSTANFMTFSDSELSELNRALRQRLDVLAKARAQFVQILVDEHMEKDARRPGFGLNEMDEYGELATSLLNGVRAEIRRRDGVDT